MPSSFHFASRSWGKGSNNSKKFTTKLDASALHTIMLFGEFFPGYPSYKQIRYLIFCKKNSLLALGKPEFFM
jgi:hypothetical protein